MKSLKLCILLAAGSAIVLTACAENRSASYEAAPAPAPGVVTGETIITLSEQEKEEGWELLFDGASTEQWRGYNREDLPEQWSAENGHLIYRPQAGVRGVDIITREKYDDFELRLEYNISERGNSGIFHHVIEQPDHQIYWSGAEFQILDNQAYPDVNDDQLSSSLYDLIAANPQNTLPAGEWNTVRIISDGPNMEYWQNGEKVVEFERWTPEWFELIRGTKFECHPSFGNIPNGHIGLQDHGDEVRFRDIRIRRLNRDNALP